WSADVCSADLGEYLSVFGGERVGQRIGGLDVVDDDDLAVVPPGRFREVLGGQARQDVVDVGCDRTREGLRIGDEDGRCGGPAPRLAAQVDRADATRGA